MLLNCCVCGALMRPVASNKPRDSQVWEKTSNLSLQKETKGLKDIIAFLYRHMAFDLLVSNARYRAYTVGVTWTVLGFLLPLLYLVPYATHHNITIDHAAFLMSVLGLVNIAVRPMAALVLGMPRFKGSSMIVYVFAGAVLINGLSNCICGAWTSFEALLLYVVTFGLSMSVGSSLLYTVPNGHGGDEPLPLSSWTSLHAGKFVSANWSTTSRPVGGSHWPVFIRLLCVRCVCILRRLLSHGLLLLPGQ
ncbi:Monocarboxylate transporter 6 [Larimichthys crocea]|uniref:Uncharacterized protein n=1 Tax=Larimichthys crocea TaxID=215358 RepID=A0ACD3R7Q5_LARCR|nr:Monocarboxylate transporter 6 [Larimichthys crocea]